MTTGSGIQSQSVRPQVVEVEATEDSAADLRQVPGYGPERVSPAFFTAVGGYDPRTGGMWCYCTE